MRLKKIISLLVSAVMVIGMLPAMAFAAGGGTEPPTPASVNVPMFSSELKIDFTTNEYKYAENITALSVDETDYEKCSSSFSIAENKYYLNTTDAYILILPNIFNDNKEHKIVITAKGYNDLIMKVCKESNNNWTSEVVTEDSGDNDDEEKDEIEITGEYEEDGFYTLYKLTSTTEGYIKGIEEVLVNGEAWSAETFGIPMLMGQEYYIDENELDFPAPSYSSSSGTYLSKGDIITLKNSGYDDVVLKVTDVGENFSVELYSEGSEEPDEVTSISLSENNITLKPGDTKELEVTFEPDGAEGEVTWESNNEDVATVKDGTVTAVAEGEATITVKLESDESIKATCTVTVEDDEQDVDTDELTITGETVEIGDIYKETFYALNIKDDDNYISQITSISVNGAVCQEKENASSLFGKQYYLDEESNRILFPGVSFGSEILKNGDIIKIESTGYDAIELKVVIGPNNTFTVGAPDEVVDYELHIRLVGYFEAAILGQKGYDSITGSSTSVSENKNSNAKVEVAIVKEGEKPDEDDWEVLDYENNNVDIDANKDKTYVKMYNTETNTNNSGMVGVYSVYDGSVTLAGTPETAGEYKISVVVTDTQGRTAQSNELTFKIYDLEETTLDEQIENEDLWRDMSGDGEYSFEMEPWKITIFGGDDETVTVPEELVAWYGSHTSGTYGELGTSIPWSKDPDPAQTLIIPEGCELTFVNMDIMSNVRIIVYGKINLLDTSVNGLIEVKNGGTFSMNYNNGEITHGSCINGQVRLEDGSTIENASITSFTNYLANGEYDRVNSEPVVVVSGNVTLKGDVYIKGEEAADGYGQKGLLVKDGTLTLEDGSNLAVYGGGSTFLTNDGGDAIILDNGTITGKGTIVAMGGDGGWFSSHGSGGDAVTGTGSISVENVYLQGGDSVISENSIPGAALGTGVELHPGTNHNLINGKYTEKYEAKENYWNGYLTPPSFDVYVIPDNGDPDAEIPVAVIGISLNKTKISLYVGETEKLKATVEPENANDKTVYWSSSDLDIAKVDQNGLVTAVGTGTAVITASTPGSSYKAECKIEVMKKEKNESKGGGSSYSLEEIEGGSYDTETPVIGSGDDEELVFIDVNKSNPNYDAIMEAYENGWMVGVSDNVFAPEGTLTRAMAAQIIWNMAGNPESSVTAPFLDVTSDAWYADAVAWAYEQGIILGYDSLTFGPDDYVTMEQFEIMIDKYNGETPAAYTGVSSLATRGWVAGKIAG